jgi:hypothetical protein
MIGTQGFAVHGLMTVASLKFDNIVNNIFLIYCVSLGITKRVPINERLFWIGFATIATAVFFIELFAPLKAGEIMFCILLGLLILVNITMFGKKIYQWRCCRRAKKVKPDQREPVVTKEDKKVKVDPWHARWYWMTVAAIALGLIFLGFSLDDDNTTGFCGPVRCHLAWHMCYLIGAGLLYLYFDTEPDYKERKKYQEDLCEGLCTRKAKKDKDKPKLKRSEKASRDLPKMMSSTPAAVVVADDGEDGNDIPRLSPKHKL